MSHRRAGCRPRFGKWILVAVAVAAILVTVLLGIVLAVFYFGALPLEGGTLLGDSCVETVTEKWGPVTIGSYLIALGEGGFALVDAGMDPDAGAIRAALRDRGAGPQDVKFIFLTHAHGDHVGGVSSFPDAQVYAIETDAAHLRRSGVRDVRGLAGGEVVAASGTDVEVFAFAGPHARKRSVSSLRRTVPR